MGPGVGHDRRKPLALGVWVVLLGVACLSVPCAGAATTTIAREGILKAEVEDDFARGSAAVTYSLRTDAGKVPVLPTELVEAAPGDTVRVRGTMRGGELVGAVEGAAPRAAVPPPGGARKVAVILFRFPDSPAEPWPVSTTRERVFTGSSSASAFYQEETYGRISLTGKLRTDGDVFGWYTLPAPSAACPYDAWRSEARAAAEAAGVSLSGYEHIIFVNAPRPCEAAGIAEIGGTQINVFGNQNSNTYAHELGHNLGLHHASTQNCTENGVPVTTGGTCIANQYGDLFDNMGGGNLRHNHAGSLAWLGALSAQNTQTYGGSGTYTLKAPLIQGLAPTTLRIPRITDTEGHVTSWYYLEVRERGGVFENVSDASMTGIAIRIASEPTASTNTILLDTNPGTSTFADAPLAVGKSLVAGNVHIQTLSAGSGSATVAVGISGTDDSSPPTAPTQLTATQSGMNVNLTWSASSDDIGVVGYTIFRDGTEVGTASDTSFTDTGAKPGAHAYTVSAQDFSGNRGPASAPYSLNVTDKTPPAAPTQLTPQQQKKAVLIGWTPSADNVAVVRYLVFRDGAEIGTATGSALTDPNPQVGLRSYVVYAEDAAGNRSLASSAKAIMVADVTAPSAPSQLLGSQQGTGVKLVWTASSDEVGVARYSVFRDGAEIAVVTDPDYLDPAPPLGQHTYFVCAEDAAGNRSPGSPAAVLTVADISAPSAPSLASGYQTAAGVTLNWLQSSDNVGVAAYLVFRDGVKIGSTPNRTFLDAGASVGAHGYVLYAEDAAGNRSPASPPLSFTVIVAVPTDASASRSLREPRLRWHRRLDGNLEFEVDASSVGGIVRVVLWFDGKKHRGARGTTLQASWNPIRAETCARLHRLSARAYDASGAFSVASAVIRIRPSELPPRCR